MIIIEQNINQDKYNEKLTDENCFIKLVKQNANIMVLNEVVRPEFIVERINSLTNGKYDYVFNEKDLYYPDKQGNKKTHNKILIFFEKDKFELVYKNENLYSSSNHLDFLHISLQDIDKNEINVIGIRIYPTNKEPKEVGFEDAKVSYNTFCKLLKYASLYKNVILTGDFNNGWIMKDGIYDKEVRFYYYNYHKMHNAVIMYGGFKLLTDGINTDGYTFDYPDQKNKWTSYSDYPTINDHFIISDNYNINKTSIVSIDDKEVEFKGFGKPNHKIVRLEVSFIFNSKLKINPLFTDEFRINICLFLEFFQYLENSLKDIYAKLIDGHYPECFDEVAEKPIGALIKKLKEVESSENVKFLSDEDYLNLDKVREMRNYWCHTCYNQGDGYLETQSDGSIVKKSRNLIEKIIREREIVRILGLKLSDISMKIPERVGKWRLDDFIRIVGPINYIQIGG